MDLMLHACDGGRLPCSSPLVPSSADLLLEVPVASETNAAGG